VLSAAFALTTGLSAFLLFLVQPLISKAILPWFGGGPGVWTTAMLFFQLVLLAGYAYAHGLSARLSVRAQVVVHCVVLTLALACLPIALDPAGKPTSEDDPVRRILALLSLSVGVPYFVLSTTGPLLQRWFGTLFPGRLPYGLYALSNAGSLLALLAYPVVLEGRFDVGDQSRGWSWAFAAFALGVLGCALPLFSRAPVADAAAPRDGRHASTQPTRSDRSLWFALSLMPSWMLLAITNQLCIDVASVPFLWVAPLTIYLLSFVICFGSPRAYHRGAFAALWVIATTALCAQLIDPTHGSLPRQIAIYLCAFAACAMLCHGELARRRPPLDQLTAYYLWISIGGAAGGLFVGVLAPLIFVDYYELHFGVIACYGLVLALLAAERRRSNVRLPLLLTALGLGVNVFGLTAAAALAQGADQVSGRTIDQMRNFYGVLRVAETKGGRILTHGRIWHGIQRTEPGRRSEATLYYGEASGIARVLSQSQSSARPQRIGIVGLGIGTLARFGKQGDVYRFYEIDPNVILIAQRHFTFLQDSAARVELVEGDGRLSLEREAPQRFDVLVIDAFSSDAIPVHLLTAEAFEVYRKHIRDDGVLAVHVSNRYLDLLPVALGAARAIDLNVRVVRVEANFEKLISPSTWVLLVPDPARLTFGSREESVTSRLWTDARSSLFDVLR
jgi:hypothetical protein